MKTWKQFLCRRASLSLLSLGCVVCVGASAFAQKSRAPRQDGGAEFGPIVRAYLGYLRAQQEVVDDRISRREINPLYYRHNSNRIKALRQMAMHIARESGNDYLPELEAVSLDEFETLFDVAPVAGALRVGGVLGYTFRYLGAVTTGREKFYLFARLDPYEQAELRKKGEAETSPPPPAPAAAARTSSHPAATSDVPPRPRRVNSP